MDLFNTYEENLAEIFQSINNDIKLLQESSNSAATRRGIISQIETNMKEAEMLMNSLKLRKTTIPNSLQSIASQKITAHEATIKSLHRDILQAKTMGSIGDRAELFGDRAGDDIRITMNDQRDRFSESVDRMAKSNDYLKSSRMLIEEALSQSDDILMNVAMQDEQLTSSRNRLASINSGLDSSNNLMRRIFARAIMNKIIIGVVAAVIIFTILLIVWLKWLH
eukprot:TRINITY_DN12554_c0_g1_i1.p1 TRINITY_DN12554_c0_g1~~TRINITY_DN12554_c0_g1_i1.p1  ORF type:complete len:230 (+),score=74.41 TRINITY_DN12554_c0_g1_i1:23-691(+)